jgi:hypothetical protein
MPMPTPMSTCADAAVDAANATRPNATPTIFLFIFPTPRTFECDVSGYGSECRRGRWTHVQRRCEIGNTGLPVCPNCELMALTIQRLANPLVRLQRCGHTATGVSLGEPRMERPTSSTFVDASCDVISGATNSRAPMCHDGSKKEGARRSHGQSGKGGQSEGWRRFGGRPDRACTGSCRHSPDTWNGLLMKLQASC